MWHQSLDWHIIAERFSKEHVLLTRENGICVYLRRAKRNHTISHVGRDEPREDGSK